MTNIKKSNNYNNIKNNYNMKLHSKLNDIECNYTIDKLTELFIPKINDKITKNDINELNKNIDLHKQEYQDHSKLWKYRNDTPYKLITDTEHQVKNINIKEIKKLIIHKVTTNDRNVEEYNKKFNQIKGDIENYDNELKTIYSVSEQNKHKKQFEYNHIYKQQIINEIDDDNETHNDKLNKINENNKYEQEKNIVIDNFINDVFTEDEIKMYM